MTETTDRIPGRLAGLDRIVVKIGSSLLVTDGETEGIDRSWLESLVEDIVWLMKAGKEVLVVSSGAIALGRNQLSLDGRLKLEEGQAAAAVGQIQLAHAWQEVLGQHGLAVAQILLTLGDTEERRRYLNARDTIATLLRLGTVPVINENDTVATNEIRFGDNDRLAARVAEMVEADCLVVLSDVDGLYDADPSKNEAAKLIPEVTEITPEIERMASVTRTIIGRGGMITKIEAARIALRAGCHMVITGGHRENPIQAMARHDHTWFIAAASHTAARKKWIAGTLQPMGVLIVDSGAEKALRGGNSLLPAGVTSVEGDFDRGDAVIVKNGGGEEIGRGLVAYSKTDAERIAGHKSNEIEAHLGYRGRDEMIHRDDLVLH